MRTNEFIDRELEEMSSEYEPSGRVHGKYYRAYRKGQAVPTDAVPKNAAASPIVHMF